MPPADHRRRIAMDTNPSILVVLSDDLLSHLRRVAQEKHIPLRWLVAGLVCDTFESRIEQTMNRQAALMGRSPLTLANCDESENAGERALLKFKEALPPDRSASTTGSMLEGRNPRNSCCCSTA